MGECNMRFGILSQWFDPEPGPAGLPGALARGLAARGHEVEVVTGFPNYPSGKLAQGYKIRPKSVEVCDGVRITRTALYPSHSDSTIGRLLNYGSFAASATALGVPSAFKDIDAMWVNYSPVTLALPMMTQHLFRRTPSVVHVLDLWPDTLTAAGFAGSGGLGSLAAKRMLDFVCGVMYRAANTVAYISPSVGPALEERGVDSSKLAYVPMWANESIFGQDTKQIDTRLPDRPIELLYAGTLGRAQGLEFLIEAAANLADLPFVCKIAGSGTEEQKLKDLAALLGARSVEFLGRVPQEDVPELMATADLHFISLNSDPLAQMTMPSKIQSILASSGAIIGALTGDAADVVEKSNSGWTCPPGDARALEHVIREAIELGRPNLAHRKAAARAFYESEFSFSRGVQQIESLLMDAALARR